MYKIFMRITVLILLNLFAFIVFGTILGEIFGNKKAFLIGAIVVSIIPLIIILFFEMKKASNQLNNINKEKNVGDTK